MIIWDLLYLCFLEAPIKSELEKTLAYVIHNGTIEQAKEANDKYCQEP